MSIPPRKRASPKRPWSQPLADLVAAAIDPVLARQGFSESDLIVNWDDIVGERLAANSRPIKLQWPPRPAGRGPEAPPQAATLLVRVEGGFALELQHMADQVLARVNSHLGWRCVGRLAFRQGPIDHLDRTKAVRRSPSSIAVTAAGAEVADVSDEALRAALTRLGAHVFTKDVFTKDVFTKDVLTRDVLTRDALSRDVPT